MIKKEKIVIEKLVWASPQGNLFIYRIKPTNIFTKLKKHKLYRTYSIFSETELSVGMEIEVDIKIKNKKDSEDYFIEKIYHEFPKDAKSQWLYLEKMCSSNNFKTIYKKIFESYTQNILILDYLITDFNLQNLLSLFETDNNKERLIKMINKLKETKSHTVFLNDLPEDIADLLTESQVRKIIEIDPNNPTSLAQDFIKNPFFAMKAEGLGFKTLDMIREKMYNSNPDKKEYAPDSAFRLYYGCYSVVYDEIMQKGNTYIDLFDFKVLIQKNLNITKERVETFLEDESENIAFLSDFKLKVHNDVITTKDLYDSELFIYDYLNEKSFINYKSEFEKEKIDLFLKQQGIELTDEQKDVFNSSLEKNIMLVLGPGGVGKTYTISKLINFLDKELNKKVKLLAPTGKAAQVLSSYTNKNSTTIHSFLSISGEEPFDKYSPTIKDSKPDYIVIDEFSMVGSSLFAKLLKYISTYKKDIKLILVGDEYQLPSVSPGNLLHIFAKNDLVKAIRLTKNVRVSNNNSGIIKLSEEFRKGYFSLKNEDNSMYAVNKDCYVQNIPILNNLYVQTLAVYNKLLTYNIKPEDIVILTPTNKGITGQAELNVSIQKIIRNHQGKTDLEPCLEQNVYGVKTRFYVDDLVLIQENRIVPEFETEKDVRINNGDTAKIIEFDSFNITLELLNSGKQIVIPVGDLSIINLGYAYTIHKSQGSESKYGVLLIPSNSYFQLNSNLLYTGITRFKEKAFLLGDFKTIRAKVNTFVNKERDTLLDRFVNSDDIIF